jgi:hypothetical protein
MGNSGSLPQRVGGQVQKATKNLQRKVRGKNAVREDHVEIQPTFGGRRLAVFCDACGAVIPAGEKFLPVRGGTSPSLDRDICDICAHTYPAEGHVPLCSPILLPDPWRMETMYRTPDCDALLNGCDSLREAMSRCLVAYFDRPLLGVLERRHGRNKADDAKQVSSAEMRSNPSFFNLFCEDKA